MSVSDQQWEGNWIDIQKPQKKTRERLEGKSVKGVPYFDWEQGEAEKFRGQGKTIVEIKKLIKKKRDYYGKQEQKVGEAREKAKAKKLGVKIEKKPKVAKEDIVSSLKKRQDEILSNPDHPIFNSEDGLYRAEGFTPEMVVFDPRFLLASIKYTSMDINNFLRLQVMNTPDSQTRAQAINSGEALPFEVWSEMVAGQRQAYEKDEPTIPEKMKKVGGPEKFDLERPPTFFGEVSDIEASGQTDIDYTPKDVPFQQSAIGTDYGEALPVLRMNDMEYQSTLTNPIIDQRGVHQVYPLPPPVKDRPETWGLDSKSINQGKYAYNHYVSVARKWRAKDIGIGRFKGAEVGQVEYEDFPLAFNSGSKPIYNESGVLTDEEHSRLMAKYETKKEEFYNLVPDKKRVEGAQWLDIPQLSTEIEEGANLSKFKIGDNERYTQEREVDPDWVYTIGSQGGLLYVGRKGTYKRARGGLLELGENQTGGIRQLPPIQVVLYKELGLVFVRGETRLDYFGKLKSRVAYGQVKYADSSVLLKKDFEKDYRHLEEDIFINDILNLVPHRFIEIEGDSYGVSSGINLQVDYTTYRAKLSSDAYHKKAKGFHRMLALVNNQVVEERVNDIIVKYAVDYEPLFMMNDPTEDTTAEGDDNVFDRANKNREDVLDELKSYLPEGLGEEPRIKTTDEFDRPIRKYQGLLEGSERLWGDHIESIYDRVKRQTSQVVQQRESIAKSVAVEGLKVKMYDLLEVFSDEMTTELMLGDHTLTYLSKDRRGDIQFALNEGGVRNMFSDDKPYELRYVGGAPNTPNAIKFIERYFREFPQVAYQDIDEEYENFEIEFENPEQRRYWVNRSDNVYKEVRDRIVAEGEPDLPEDEQSDDDDGLRKITYQGVDYYVDDEMDGEVLNDELTSVGEWDGESINFHNSEYALEHREHPDYTGPRPKKSTFTLPPTQPQSSSPEDYDEPEEPLPVEEVKRLAKLVEKEYQRYIMVWGSSEGKHFRTSRNYSSLPSDAKYRLPSHRLTNGKVVFSDPKYN